MTKKIKQNGPTMVKGIFAVGGVSAILGKPMSGATFDLEMFRWVNESGDDVALVIQNDDDDDFESEEGWPIVCDVDKVSEDQLLKIAGFCKIRGYGFITSDLSDAVCDDCRESAH